MRASLTRPKKRAGSRRRVTRLDSRERWVALLRKFMAAMSEPQSPRIWAPKFESASRAKIRDIQEEKLAALLPYLYDHSGFYRERFKAAKLKPTDIRGVHELPKFPVTGKTAMAEDVAARPPWGTYTPVDDRTWRSRGWMVFCTSGTTAVPRSFRYTSTDAAIWAVTSARALYATGLRTGDSALTCTNYNPHVFFWSLHYALNLMKIAIVPGGVATERRAQMIDSYGVTAIAATPSYALHLADTMKRIGIDPRKTAVKRIICGGEPASGIPATRRRIEDAWDARLHDIYGCTEAVPAGWAFTCEQAIDTTPVSTHVQEDLQIWETVDAETMESVSGDTKGLTVVTNLNSEGSPQLRFLVGDFTTFDESRCSCGRTFKRAVSGFQGRADDMLIIKGLKLFPSAVEEIIRGFAECGDEFQIVLETEGVMDSFKIVAETKSGPASDIEKLRARITSEVVRRCELRPKVEIVAPGTLPKTEFKARRVIDRRQ